jgi:hypothetical protein
MKGWWLRLLLFAALWWLLTDGDLHAGLIGLVAVPAATWLSVRLTVMV